ncbi:hypothetical protein DL96DRAFT_1613941 [Flagelloscypha sp. PMI_526]|nr:hypothetical protein DL96DRAFT_1613941 [Flagelloscypha sp. PMI_526]
MTSPPYPDLALPLGLCPLLVEKCWQSISPNDTDRTLLARLDVWLDTACAKNWLAPLKVHIHSVTEDLAAVSSLNDVITVQGSCTARLFWTYILAILWTHKKRKCVFNCLVVVLRKVHETTRTLRRVMPAAVDISRVHELHITIIHLLSRAVPQRFLLLFHCLMKPNKILHDSKIKYHLDDLSTSVRGLLHSVKDLPTHILLASMRCRNLEMAPTKDDTEANEK